MAKVFYMFFALFIFSKVTSLGDTFSYLNGSHFSFGEFFFSSTKMLGTIAFLLNSSFGLIVANLFFLFLSFYGIYYSLSRLMLSSKELIPILLLLSLPSFGIWTSIASKEAVGVFYMGIILGYIIDLLENKKRKIRLIEYLAFYLLFIFKAHFFAAIIPILVYIKISYWLHLRTFGKSILLLAHIVISISFFYYFKDIISDISFTIPNHFSMDAGSTRENDIWVGEYDVFLNAPYGMFIAFWGPTFYEVLEKPIQGIAFFESLIIFCLFIYFIYKASWLVLKSGKINIIYLSIFFMATFWLLFVHYPFGVLNPGSAIRYRENFYGFLVVLLFYLYQKIKERYKIEKVYHPC